MSYAVYKTEAIVVRTIPSGEANMDVVFLTRDLGKITARVQAGRKIESKMRMQLARYAHVVIDVVHGRQVWRLTGIASAGPERVFQDESFLKGWHRAVTLAEFLIRGEEPHPELFDFFAAFMKSSGQELPQEGVELFGVIHVLLALGYWHGEALPAVLTREIADSLTVRRKELVKMINEALEATQIVV
jgi:recombinational DNA repair protein (RecF pathway)